MKVNSLKKLTDFNWINLFEAEFTNKLGKLGKWIFASRKSNPKEISNKADAVIIVPFIREKKLGSFNYNLVMIKEFRVPINNYEYGFPAGLINNESPEVAAKRELLEETGLHVVEFLGTSPITYSSAGITDESVQYVFVEVDGEITNKANEDTEDIEIFIFNKEQVRELLRDNNVVFGARAWVMLKYIVNSHDFISPEKINFR